jgi:hypothetical protein
VGFHRCILVSVTMTALGRLSSAGRGRLRFSGPGPGYLIDCWRPRCCLVGLRAETADGTHTASSQALECVIKPALMAGDIFSLLESVAIEKYEENA